MFSLSTYLTLRRAGAVTRFHTLPVTPAQTVIEHSGYMALLAWLIFGHAGCSKELLCWCLAHDLPEVLLGDVPAPVFRAIPDLRPQFTHAEAQIHRAFGTELRLTSDDESRAHALDALECCFYAAEQVQRGDGVRYAPVLRNAYTALAEKAPLFPDEWWIALQEYFLGVLALANPFKCDRCHHSSDDLREVEPGLQWCVHCRGHDLGTIMRVRVARETTSTPGFIFRGKFYGGPGADEKLLDLEKDVVGNDDPHDTPPETLPPGTAIISLALHTALNLQHGAATTIGKGAPGTVGAVSPDGQILDVELAPGWFVRSHRDFWALRRG